MVSVYVMLLTHGLLLDFRVAILNEVYSSGCLYLDRVGRHVAHEMSAVGVIEHGHQSEGIP